MSEPLAPQYLCDPVLISCGVTHGFGLVGLQAPESTVFSRQVHGIEGLEATAAAGQSEAEADFVFTTRPGVSVGVVTADCVPILVFRPGAQSHVAAIHAGWRGLASGVIEQGLRQMSEGAEPGELVAAVGPSARGCCYEVDEPVREGLVQGGYGPLLGAVCDRASEGHFRLDLSGLATRVLEKAGLPSDQIGTAHRVCTICQPGRFESYRRDGARAGRLQHFITSPRTIRSEG